MIAKKINQRASIYKLNVSFVHDCDLLAATIGTVHRSTQTKNHPALPMARLDLPHTVLPVPFSLSLLFLLVLSHNVFFLVEKKNPTNNKL